MQGQARQDYPSETHRASFSVVGPSLSSQSGKSWWPHWEDVLAGPGQHCQVRAELCTPEPPRPVLSSLTVHLDSQAPHCRHPGHPVSKGPLVIIHVSPQRSREGSAGREASGLDPALPLPSCRPLRRLLPSLGLGLLFCTMRIFMLPF